MKSLIKSKRTSCNLEEKEGVELDIVWISSELYLFNDPSLSWIGLGFIGSSTLWLFYFKIKCIIKTKLNIIFIKI